MTLSSSERSRLAALFRDTDPSAPTLCGQWNAKDLLVHLVVRENEFPAALGIVSSRFEGSLKKQSEKAANRDYQELIDCFEQGPGALSPFRYLDRFVNAAEFFVHHEDLRRGSEPDSVAPRNFTDAENKELYTLLKWLAPMMLRSSRVPVVIEPHGFQRFVGKNKRGVATKGDQVARIRGDVGEILLYLYGRDWAHVDIVDDYDGIDRSSL
ncbi:TIGR03085 family metal-binding protein [Corynebacterium sp. ES2794-CONJ1]|uniref:TIGR03085 family metal-binding protein n=1 Tax=unclassified Corynebacterium TaxID=2624378 RepID=UPI0021692174|nr:MULTISPECIES: TIGR03085 family metal-binding protein [unclassified Corynebacterium]MCS4489143.1 TIGR03085 family metal-binding protein [Corynebacterium sp. ES2775-CONJ]MCS4490956.1 TIGR03085 family metal-binding protein [Corynebacterium sp. ES2715-CONJ3]MCS4531162.1 TIGR03085 family metal-binding protein [Corynebacterium sp. ES2730-CONJ]MCU9518530.1 TIGR03085 family metal-binding protein [Corynebacterium sp. ES2794-CONJ1]